MKRHDGFCFAVWGKPDHMSSQNIRNERNECPTHVAIIMDGNGRWADRHGLPKSEGHRRGFVAVRKTVEAATACGVKYLTLYAFSSENWRRPSSEVDFLMALCRDMLRGELKDLVKNNICLHHIGRAEGLPESVRQTIHNAVELTKNNHGLHLVLAFNYGARAEITDAVRAIARQAQQGIVQPEDIDEGMVAAHLATAGIPDPDLLIRTSGEERVSNFLLWQICYSEFYSTKTLWPDFHKKDFMKALDHYRRRRRRFGGRDA